MFACFHVYIPNIEMDNFMKEIKLTQGRFALVDDDDFEKVSNHNWQYKSDKGGRGYATRTRKVSEQSQDRKLSQQILMHRFICNIHMLSGKDIIPDHADGNGLNNQKYNLVITNMKQNCKRKKKWGKPTTSRYKGVHKRKDSGKFRARITSEHDRTTIGNFDCEIDAAKAYDVYAAMLFGDFAEYNFIGSKGSCQKTLS